MPYIRFFRAAIIFCLGLLFLGFPFSSAQDIPQTSATESEVKPDSVDPFKISVSVNGVRLDVVVLDNKGRPITDLTADDFEIYQDKLPQEVASSVYINNQTSAVVSPAASRKPAQNFPPISVPDIALKEEDVCRTIVFVYELYGNRFDWLADEALRAGVVVHILDTTGLEYFEPSSNRKETRHIFKNNTGLHK